MPNRSLQKDLLILGALAGGCLLVYSPLIWLPYLFDDELWIAGSGGDSRFVPFLREVIFITQGRPVLGILLQWTGEFLGAFGVDAIALIRLLGIIATAAIAFLYYKWLASWNLDWRLALCLGFAVVTLPSFAAYIAVSPWVTLAVLASMAAMWTLRSGLESTQPFVRKVACLFVASTVLIACFATYQVIPLFAFAMLVVPATTLLDEPSQRKSTLMLIGKSAVFVIACMGIYYLFWRLTFEHLLPGYVQPRYSPAAVSFFDLPGRLATFFLYRLPSILDLWALGTLPPEALPARMPQDAVLLQLSISEGGLIAAITGRLILLGFLIEMAYALMDKERGAKAGWVAAKYGLILVLLVLCDAGMLLAPIPVYSYLTAGALTAGVAVVVLHALRKVLVPARNVLPKDTLVWVLLVVAFAGALQAQKSMLTHFAAPLFVEYRLAKNMVAKARNTDGEVCGIKVNGNRYSLLDRGRGEFAASNLIIAPNMYHMLRNILREHGMPLVPIEFTIPWTGETVRNPRYGIIDPECRPLIIDFDGLNLR